MPIELNLVFIKLPITPLLYLTTAFSIASLNPLENLFPKLIPVEATFEADAFNFAKNPVGALTISLLLLLFLLLRAAIPATPAPAPTKLEAADALVKRL